MSILGSKTLLLCSGHVHTLNLTFKFQTIIIDTAVFRLLSRKTTLFYTVVVKMKEKKTKHLRNVEIWHSYKVSRSLHGLHLNEFCYGSPIALIGRMECVI